MVEINSSIFKKEKNFGLFKRWELMIQWCEDHSEVLDDWSAGFIDSISKQLSDKNFLTEKQADKLEQIYQEASEDVYEDGDMPIFPKD